MGEERREIGPIKRAALFTEGALGFLFGSPVSLRTVQRWSGDCQLGIGAKYVNPDSEAAEWLRGVRRVRPLKTPRRLGKELSLARDALLLQRNEPSPQNLLRYFEGLHQLTARLCPDGGSSPPRLFIPGRRSEVGDVPILGTLALRVKDQVLKAHILGCINEGGEGGRFLPNKKGRGFLRQVGLLAKGRRDLGIARFTLLAVIEEPGGEREIGKIQFRFATAMTLGGKEVATLVSVYPDRPDDSSPVVETPTYNNLVIEELELLVDPDVVPFMSRPKE